MRKMMKGCLGVAAALIAVHFALAEVNAGVFSECSPCGEALCDPCDPCGTNPCDPCGTSSKGLFGSKRSANRPGGLEYGGWVEAGWFGNEYGNKPAYIDGAFDPLSGNTFVLQNVANSHPQMNQAVFFVGKSLDTRKGFDIGGRFDFMYGTDARFLQSQGLELNARTGYSAWSKGDYSAAIAQAYGEVGIGNFSLKAGKFLSVLNTDFDSPYAVDRFFYSTPYTHFQVTANELSLAIAKENLAHLDINELIGKALAPSGGAMPVPITDPTFMQQKFEDFVVANAKPFADDVNNALTQDVKDIIGGNVLIDPATGALPNGALPFLKEVQDYVVSLGGTPADVQTVTDYYNDTITTEVDKALGIDTAAEAARLGVEVAELTVQNACDAGADMTYFGVPAGLDLEAAIFLAQNVNLAGLAQMSLGIKPHTMTGVIGTWNAGRDLSFYAGWTNGENQTFFDAKDNAFVGGVRYKIGPRASIGYGLMLGKSENMFGYGIQREYFVQSLYFSTKIGKKWHYNIDWTLRNDSIGFGGATYLRYGGFGLNQELIREINKQWAFGGRFEWMCLYGSMKKPFTDLIGTTPQSGTLPVFNYTLGVNWTPSNWLRIRPEVRWDVVPGADPFNGASRNYQCSFGASAIAKF